LAKGFPFEFEMGRKMVEEFGSSRKDMKILEHRRVHQSLWRR
jgi:hypothetical protein